MFGPGDDSGVQPEERAQSASPVHGEKESSLVKTMVADNPLSRSFTVMYADGQGDVELKEF